MWNYYDKKLDRYELELDILEYESVVKDPYRRRRADLGFFTKEEIEQITPDQINGLLTTIGPSFGYGVFTTLPLPAFPILPTLPKPQDLSSILTNPTGRTRSDFSPAIREKEARLKTKAENKRLEFEQTRRTNQDRLDGWRLSCEATISMLFAL